MSNLSYVLVTPYTVAKSRTGGVIARLLVRSDLELVAAQMIAPDEAFVSAYAAALREENPTNDVTLLADYVEKNLAPSQGRRHRTLLLLFRGGDPVRKLSDICGALYAEHRTVESITGETIRDTYADMIVDEDGHVTYFEPAVITPRSQSFADRDLAMFACYLKDQPNIIENITYPDPSIIEKTLVIIKPDNWIYNSSRPGTIIDMFSRTGLRIVGIKVHRFTLEEALEFYGPVEAALKEKLSDGYAAKAKALLEKELEVTLDDEASAVCLKEIGIACARDQFAQIVEFMSGFRPGAKKADDKPVKCMILIYEGEQAVSKIRAVLGPTDPLKAAAGTVRREFGSNVMVNTAHASDSVPSFEREAKIVRINHNSLAKVIEDGELR